MRLFRLSMICLLILVMATSLKAEEKDDKRLTNEAQLGFVDTSGNSKVTTLAFRNRLKYKFTEKLLGAWDVGALYGESDGDKSAERYFTDLRFDYSITDPFYVYAAGGWLRDEFAGFNARWYAGPGVGYKFLVGPKHFLLGEVGLNYAYEDYDADGSDQFLEGRVFGKYEFAFTEKTKISQSLEYLQGFDETSNWKLNSETALLTTLTDILSLKVSYAVRYNNNPTPSDLDETDTILAASFVVNY